MWWWLETPTQNLNGFNITELNTDEAWLNISSSYDKPLWLYTVSDDCYTCSFQKFLQEPILQNHSYKAIVSTRHGLRFRLRTTGESNFTPSINDRLCDLQANLGEFGVYSAFVAHDAQSSVQCSLVHDVEPVNIYLPILVTLIFWLIASFVAKLIGKNWILLTSTLRRLCLRTLGLCIAPTPVQDDRIPVVAESSHDLPADFKNIDATDKEPTDDPSSASRIPRKRKKKIVIEQPSRDKLIARGNDTGNTSSQPSTSTAAHTTPDSDTSCRKARLKSLDAFRGICIIIMIFADDGGGGYFFFQHSTWDGLYIADLAFPWFLWICGTSIPLSMSQRLSNGAKKWKLFKDIVIRSLKLMLLGIIVNTSTRATPVQLEYLRFPGVLQRFGLCYLIGSTLFALFHNNAQPNGASELEDENSFCWKRFVKRLAPWCTVFMCVGFHTLIMFLLPVPLCPKYANTTTMHNSRGYLGPAGLHNDSALPATCVGGAAGYVDRLIFGVNHIHNRPTSQKVYGSGPFDPEGLLGVLTSILQIWLGIQAGVIMLTYNTAKSRTTRLFAYSIICGVTGYILCGGISNTGWVPVNKNLWSLSFVLVTTSLAMATLTVLYLVIDEYAKWSGSPLVETGRNSILLYLGHEIFHAILPWHFSYGRMVSHSSKLMETSWGTVLWIVVAVYLHDQQLFFVV